VWSLVIPVKRLGEAKTRLAPRTDSQRARLALAFAADTAAAALASPLVDQVLVVTGDPAVAERLGRIGALIVPEPEPGGLNEAIEAGRAAALASRPGGRIAALTADLPGLRTAELTAVLAAAPGGRCFVPDASGLGTTLLMSDEAGLLAPEYGLDSRRLHESGGAKPLEEVGATVRRDVDVPEDLAAVLRHGVGADTAAVLAAAVLGAGSEQA
jgi:2-phospho-L-lactate/phosphoenolpyruvate guanylyltransferase